MGEQGRGPADRQVFLLCATIFSAAFSGQNEEKINHKTNLHDGSVAYS